MKTKKFLKSALIKTYRSILLGKNFIPNLRIILNILNKESYYPELPRKSKGKIFLDNIEYLLQNQEVNPYYLSYGFDVKDPEEIKNYLSHREFVEARQAGNQKLIKTPTGAYNYIVLLRDKYIFSSFIETTLGKDVIPATLGLIENKKVFDHSKKEWVELDSFMSSINNAVLKKLDGECGEDIYFVDTRENKLFVNGQVKPLDEFEKTLANSRYLIQEKLEQHPILNKLNPGSINTLRIVTIKNSQTEDIDVFSAMLRVGSDPNIPVDNRALGGIGIGVNLKTGQLDNFGFLHEEFGTRLNKHPFSKIEFNQISLPYWNELIDMVKKAHKQFYSIESIGWDIAFTKEGPIFLEGNDNWEIGGPQDTQSGLKQKWLKLTGKNYIDRDLDLIL